MASTTSSHATCRTSLNCTVRALLSVPQSYAVLDLVWMEAWLFLSPLYKRGAGGDFSRAGVRQIPPHPPLPKGVRIRYTENCMPLICTQSRWLSLHSGVHPVAEKVKGFL